MTDPRASNTLLYTCSACSEQWRHGEQHVCEKALLPCPFCGRSARFEQCEGKATNEVRWSIGCVMDMDAETRGDMQCIGWMSMQTHARKSDAAKAWNARATRELPTTQDDDYVFAAGHYANCGVYEGTQRGPCSCRQIYEQNRAAQPPPPEWQPIETAPKDGRPFLAIGMGPMFICRWGSGANIWMDQSGQWRDPRLWQHLPEGPCLLPSAYSTATKEGNQAGQPCAGDCMQAPTPRGSLPNSLGTQIPGCIHGSAPTTLCDVCYPSEGEEVKP